eukprot:Pgem_evm1s13177
MNTPTNSPMEKIDYTPITPTRDLKLPGSLTLVNPTAKYGKLSQIKNNTFFNHLVATDQLTYDSFYGNERAKQTGSLPETSKLNAGCVLCKNNNNQ